MKQLHDLALRLGQFLEEKRTWVIVLFFAIYLIAGIFLIDDYGLSIDEEIQRVWGNEYYDLITKKDPADIFIQGKYYGPFYAIILAFQEHLFNLHDSREIFLSFHATSFIFFFIGVIFFFLLGQKIVNEWKLSLLACSILILSPRIFADSFYNPKDIPLLTLFILSIYTMLLLYEKPTTLTAILHGLATAATIDMRLIGLMIPVMTIALLFFKLCLGYEGKWIRIVTFLGLYLVTTFGFTILFWPVLYFDPSIFTQSLKYMSSFPYEWPILYRGAYYHCTELYRNYLPTWIAITTPISYLFLFITGGMVIVFRLIKNKSKPGWIKDHLSYLLLLAWSLVPILYVIILRPCVYNSWRHFYFTYPAFVLIGVLGIEFLYKIIRESKVLHGIGSRIGSIILTVLIAAFLSHVAYIMYLDHPNEYVYFNRFAGKDMKEIMTQYETDYYGVAYRQALEYIVDNDPSPWIKILKSRLEMEKNAGLLKMDDRHRLYFCTPEEDPDYLIIPGEDLPPQYPEASLFYTINVSNGRILSVYRLKQ